MTTLGSVRSLGKDLLKSKRQADQDSIDRMVDAFQAMKPGDTDLSNKNREKFKAALENTIDLKFAEIMKGRGSADRYLSYVDGQVLSTTVRNVFKTALGSTPPQVEAACTLSEALLAPTREETENLIKAAVGIGGGAAGIAMIIAAVGAALGWGAGVVAGVTAFFVGTSLAGPVGWTIAGVTLAGVAGYFATSSSKLSDTERFMAMLKAANARAVDAIWSENEKALVQALSARTGA